MAGKITVILIIVSSAVFAAGAAVRSKAKEKEVKLAGTGIILTSAVFLLTGLFFTALFGESPGACAAFAIVLTLASAAGFICLRRD